MPMLFNNPNVWNKVIQVLKVCARFPLALLAITTAGFISWSLFWILYRATEYIWEHFLRRPW